MGVFTLGFFYASPNFSRPKIEFFLENDSIETAQVFIAKKTLNLDSDSLLKRDITIEGIVFIKNRTLVNGIENIQVYKVKDTSRCRNFPEKEKKEKKAQKEKTQYNSPVKTSSVNYSGRNSDTFYSHKTIVSGICTSNEKRVYSVLSMEVVFLPVLYIDIYNDFDNRKLIFFNEVQNNIRIRPPPVGYLYC